ncbi:MAG: VOC family protein [Burkholderiales bacterium]
MTGHTMQLGAVRVFVDDVLVARDFYANRLGLELRVDGPRFGYCVFRSGTVELIVEAAGADAPADDRALVGRFTGLSFDVADIQAEHQRLSGLGVPFGGAPELQPWGGCLATLRDPSGNQLQLTQREG